MIFPFKENVKPAVLKARNVPYFMLKDKVCKELGRLLKEGVLELMVHPKWYTPIVVVSKLNGEVKIYGDYWTTVNKILQADCIQCQKFKIFR